MSTNKRGHSASSPSFVPFIMLLAVWQGRQYEVLASVPAYLKNLVVVFLQIFKRWLYPIKWADMAKVVLWLDGSRLRIPADHEVILQKSPYGLLGSPSLPIDGHTGSSLPRVKRLGSEADHTSLSSTEVKSDWSDTSTPPTCPYSIYRKKLAFFSNKLINVRICMILFPSVQSKGWIPIIIICQKKVQNSDTQAICHILSHHIEMLPGVIMWIITG